VEAGSFFMHDSDNFQWMKPDADVLSLTGFAAGAANTGRLFTQKRKLKGLAEPYRVPTHL
jgi:hypothetical protein